MDWTLHPMRPLLSLIFGLAMSFPAFANLIESHGYAQFGTLKYPASFTHFDWVNPDAPKGGYFTTWGFGTFDSLRPYILLGNAASSASMLYDSLMTGSADEPDALYGLVAETIEYPESREWIIFNIRPEARFHDGTPITARFIAGAVASALPLATSAKARAQGSENSHSSRQDSRIHA